MLGGERIASCLAALLVLTPTFAQSRHPQPQRSPQSHSQQPRPQANQRPPQREARPPQNQPGHAGKWIRRYKDLPPDQRSPQLENELQFRKLPPERQDRLQNKLHNFSKQPPQ